MKRTIFKKEIVHPAFQKFENFFWILVFMAVLAIENNVFCKLEKNLK